MATQTGLYLDFAAGEVKPLSTGDTVEPASLGTGTPDNTKFLRGDGVWTTPSVAASAEIKQTEIDFGSTPVSDGNFTITDATAVVGALIMATMAYDAVTGKDLDEFEMDELDIKCGNASGGSFTMLVKSKDGSYLEGKFKINYIIYFAA